MKTQFKQSGRTLAEMAVVIAAIVMLGSFGLPAIRTFLDSFESGTGPKPVISAALASARAIAAKEQRYAGIRFQKAYHPDGPLKAPQYMVIIVHEEPRKMGNITVGGFRAVDGINPMKLPDSLGVIDSDLIKQKVNINPMWEPSGDPELTDLTSFSIIFSPSGKMLIQDVRVRNRDGRTTGTETPNISMDDVFNTVGKVTNANNPVGMFIQDDYASLGLQQEPSRRSFVIYDRLEFKRAYEKGQAYSGYLQNLLPDAIHINPYTGTMIEK